MTDQKPENSEQHPQVRVDCGVRARKHDGDNREFRLLSESWYGPACLRGQNIVDEITIGFYSPEGGTSGEFQIKWEPLGGKVTPKLYAYDDSWSALYAFSDVLKIMADHDGEDSSPLEVCEWLLACGVKDKTQRQEPRITPS